MENAVDAIKIAFGLLVFAIALTLTFSVIGQARVAADVIFQTSDKREYYDYATEQDYNAQENRIVGFDTILPTIHRYAKEQYAVTIFNTNGVPIVRYDLYTEGFMANWNEIIKNMRNGDTDARMRYEEVKERLDMVQSVVNRKLNTNVDIMQYIGDESSILSSSSALLYYGKTDVGSINVVAPWMGDPDVDTVDRIKADMPLGGKYVKNYGSYEVTYYGKNLMQYKDRKFREMFLEIATSGQTITDGSDYVETIRGNQKLEIIYILEP